MKIWWNIVGSFTGGLTYDRRASTKINVTHAIIWGSLLISSLLINLGGKLATKCRLSLGLTHGFLVICFVGCIKIVVWRMHYLLDHHGLIKCDNPVSTESSTSLGLQGLFRISNSEPQGNEEPHNVNRLDDPSDPLSSKDSTASSDPTDQEDRTSTSSEDTIHIRRQSDHAHATVKKTEEEQTCRFELPRCFPKKWNPKLNRLQLDSLFDRCTKVPEIITCIVLTGTVCFLGFFANQTDYLGTGSVILCTISMTICQYGFLKSIAPDPASPNHGYDFSMICARPLFFSVVAAMYILSNNLCVDSDARTMEYTHSLLPYNMSPDKVGAGELSVIIITSRVCKDSPNICLLHESTAQRRFIGIQGIANPDNKPYPFTIYGISFSWEIVSGLVRKILAWILVLFPLISGFGMISRPKTTLIALLEQVDIHLFGGTGATGFLSLLFGLVRVAIVLGVDFSVCIYGISIGEFDNLCISFFWGVQLAMCFVLSRLPSNINLYKQLASYLGSGQRLRKDCAQDRQTEVNNVDLIQHRGNQRLLGGRRSPSLSSSNSWPSTNSSHKREEHCSSASLRPVPRQLSLSKPPLISASKLSSSSEVVCCRHTRRFSSPSVLVTYEPPPPPPEVSEPTPIDSPSSSPDVLSYYSSTVSDIDYEDGKELTDPLPDLFQRCLLDRAQSDIFLFLLWILSGLCMHRLYLLVSPDNRPLVLTVLVILSAVFGVMLHHVWPNIRQPQPWLIFNKAFISTDGCLKVYFCERCYFWLCWIERNLLIPALTISAGTLSMSNIVNKFHLPLAAIILLVTTMKMFRNGFAGASQTYMNVFISYLLFNFDFVRLSETYLVDYLVVSTIISKLIEVRRKISFVFVYWRALRSFGPTFGSAVVKRLAIFHYTASMGSILLSVILGCPLEPMYVDAFFVPSHLRPTKYWEGDSRSEHLASTNMVISRKRWKDHGQSIFQLGEVYFYEHLARSLQESLAGDIQLGRFGGLAIHTGDIFILSSDEMNALVHIIEMGNGYVTFQLRGLQFIRTSCHNSENASFYSYLHSDSNCRCRYPNAISVVGGRHFVDIHYTAWKLVSCEYTLKGYNVAEHSTNTLLSMHAMRRNLICYFIQSVIYYTTREGEFGALSSISASCLTRRGIKSAFDVRIEDIPRDVVRATDGKKEYENTRLWFQDQYSEWIQYCVDKRPDGRVIDTGPDSTIISLCFALSYIGIRVLFPSPHKFKSKDFIRGVFELFRGNLTGLELDRRNVDGLRRLQSVLSLSMRMAVALFEEGFVHLGKMTGTELYDTIVEIQRTIVICPEADPKWTLSLFNDAQTLLSFRLVNLQASDAVTRRMILGKLVFHVIRVNSECARGLWAAQEREQIFYQTTHSERSSIQAAQHVARNILNSSCDPPIGYPVYVSPLMTSFAGMNTEYQSVSGGELSWSRLRRCFDQGRSHIRRRRNRRKEKLKKCFDDGEMYVMQTLLECPTQPKTYQVEEAVDDHLNRSNSSDPSPAERSTSTAQIHSSKEDDTKTLRSQNSSDSKTNEPNNDSCPPGAVGWGDKRLKSLTNPGYYESQFQALATLLALQDQNGFWRLDQNFAQAIDIPLNTLRCRNPLLRYRIESIDFGESIWATKTAMVFLEEIWIIFQEDWEVHTSLAASWLDATLDRYQVQGTSKKEIEAEMHCFAKRTILQYRKKVELIE
ncbi:unnamed protein product [Calicophoron daubneyi]|uniref:Pecanex-like protein n=1 Tax=Calicophoron daubneyi TaxID=300641 RepID=A0AAV2T6P6_CALDB